MLACFMYSRFDEDFTVSPTGLTMRGLVSDIKFRAKKYMISLICGAISMIMKYKHENQQKYKG